MVKAMVRTSGLLFLLLLLLTACQPIQRLPETQTTGTTVSAETSLEEANKALVNRVYDEIMNQKNLSVAGELFCPRHGHPPVRPCGRRPGLGPANHGPA